MKKALKALGLLIASVFVLIIGLILVAFWQSESKRNSTIEVTFNSFAIPADPNSIREGERSVKVRGCADCHGSDLGGKIFIDAPPIGFIYAPNITSGQGSVVASYKDTDWIRTLRYGIKPSGHPVTMMPVGDYHKLSNEDLGKMIAYLKSVPAVNRETMPLKIGPLPRVLGLFGQFPILFSYEAFDLDAAPVESVKAEESVEYGRYIASACTGCHGEGFSGGKIPGGAPDWPAAADLTSSSRVNRWTYEEFKKAITEGKTPEGKDMRPDAMPWPAFASMTDTEIRALYLFVKQIPSKPSGTR